MLVGVYVSLALSPWPPLLSLPTLLLPEERLSTSFGSTRLPCWVGLPLALMT